jgi:hypothetical protein
MEQMTKYDETVKQLLFTMEFSSDTEQKLAWMPHLITLIDTMGHATLHWVDRISSMLLDYAISADPRIWRGLLKVIMLNVYIFICKIADE